jgi:hypothetical protein
VSRADAGIEITMHHFNINTGETIAVTEILTSLQASDDAAKAVQKTKHRVSLDDMLRKIMSEEYIWPTSIPHLTICILITDNGYALIGKSAPADPDNFDIDAGKNFAKEDAIRQLWPLEGYLLRERMMI